MRQPEEINQMRVGSENVFWIRICSLKIKKIKENGEKAD